LNPGIVIVFLVGMAYLSYFLVVRNRIMRGKLAFSINANELKTHHETLTDFSYYNQLSADGKKRFLIRSLHIMQTKKFIAGEALEITDEMCLKISATIAKVTFGLSAYQLEHFHTIKIFPAAFYVDKLNAFLKGGTFGSGLIYISWHDYEKGYNNATDQLNLGLHETAHALLIDYEQGGNHTRHFNHHFPHWETEAEKIHQQVKTNRQDFFRKYAGVNMHEFWAVCVEVFFESPQAFKETFPHLYEKTSNLLNQDLLNVENDYVKIKATPF
jgi:MtfA peptidase